MRYYAGEPGDCDMCNKPLKHVGKFIDGVIQTGQWANMCPRCHAEVGRGLGTGSGQEYTRQDDGRWLKTGG